MSKFLLVTIFLFGLCSQQLFASTDDSTSRATIQSLVGAKIEITKKRIAIHQRSVEQAKNFFRSKGVSDIASLDRSKLINMGGQAHAFFQVLETEPADRVDLETALRELNQLFSAAGSTFSAFPTPSECEYAECVEILGKQNHVMIRDLQQITSKLVTQALLRLKPMTIADTEVQLAAYEQALDATSSLALANFECQNQIGQWKGGIRVDRTRLGNCFLAVTNEVASIGQPQDLGTVTDSDLSIPLNQNLGFESVAERELKKWIESQPNYQLKPWDLYRQCLKASGNQIIKANTLCYSVLRRNRVRPAFTRKLVDIRGDRMSGGDNSGDWYHLFGMARTIAAHGKLAMVVYHMTEGQLKAGIDDMLGRKTDPKEVEIDLVGAKVGQRLREHISNLKSKDPRVRQTNANYKTLEQCTMDIFGVK